jgi:hypothetical protein
MVYMGDGPIPLDAIDALIERKTAPPEPPPGIRPDGKAGCAWRGPAGDNAAAKPGKNPPGKGAKPPKKAPKAGDNLRTPAQKKSLSRRQGSWARRPRAARRRQGAKIPPPEALSLSVDRPKALRAAVR